MGEASVYRGWVVTGTIVADWIGHEGKRQGGGDFGKSSLQQQ